MKFPQLRRYVRLFAATLIFGLMSGTAILSGAPAEVFAQSNPPLQVDANAAGTCPNGYKPAPGISDVKANPKLACLRESRPTSTNCPQGNCIIEKYVNPVVNTLAALVGIAVTISIIVGGIRYATSADNPQKVSEAKQRIFNSLLVLVGFFTFYAFLNYIIPGGLR